MRPGLVEIILSRIYEMLTFSGTRLIRRIFRKWIYAPMSTHVTRCAKAICWFVKVEKWDGRRFFLEANWSLDFRKLCTGLELSTERKCLAFSTTLFIGHPSWESFWLKEIRTQFPILQARNYDDIGFRNRRFANNAPSPT